MRTDGRIDRYDEFYSRFRNFANETKNGLVALAAAAVVVVVVVVDVVVVMVTVVVVLCRSQNLIVSVVSAFVFSVVFFYSRSVSF